MVNVGSYSVGLDIGTNSLGWAVANEDGSFVLYKKRPMCGTVLIQTEGQTAAQRRGFRSTRRRLARRKQRIQWLQELMGPIVLKDDPTFFKRLKYSYVAKGDETCGIDSNFLFDTTSYYKTHAYHENYPTIYKLRKTLIESNEKMDIRLVYLALHHIIKYRGNFLYEGQTISAKNLDIKDSIFNMLNSLEILDSDDGTSLVDSLEVVFNEKERRDSKRDRITEVLTEYAPEDAEKPKNWAKTIASLILGYSIDVSVLFGLEDKMNVSFADESYYKAEELLDDFQLEQFEAIQKVYSAQVLKNILSDSVSTLSDAYISVYDKHKEDLRKLKDLLKKYSDSETYEELINTGLISYAVYIKASGKCSNETLCKTLKAELEKMPKEDKDVISCLQDIEDKAFLLKPRNSNNGAIPNQLHVEELERIIDNQARFYPELKGIKSKLISIATYRIPYFVGPLSKGSPFSWVVRKDQQKIYPWNFYEEVAANETAEAFIRRMTNKCFYLINEEVLPKESILYSEYTVLDELSNVTVDGYHLAPDCKMAALDELFKKHKCVTISMFKNWYRTNYCNGVAGLPYIKGVSDNNKFQSNMKSYIELSNIIGPLNCSAKLNEAEKIIELITLFSDKKIREQQIKRFCPDLTDNQVKSIMKLSYSGWGKFSGKLLDGILSENGHTIMDLLRSSSQNFMQIVFNKDFNFEKIINEENLSGVTSESGSVKDFVMNYPGSPAIKKCTWTAIKVIDEIQSIIGHSPSNIYIEVASGDEKKKRTISRYNKLIAKYSKIDDVSFNETYEKLKSYKENQKALDKKALLLYFLQNGKCLYSGKPLVGDLSLYQIDHILPRCYVKDDSIDNLALVFPSENQRKLDSLVLSDSIIDFQERTWENLYKNGLMSQKKFDNLRRRNVNDVELEGFINRQLVETRQICTNVFNVLKLVYNGKVPTYGVSAKLTFNLKQKIGLPKVRELNDYHHAIDAYTAILAGSFSQKRLSIPKSELNEVYRGLIRESGFNNRQARYGIIAELFYSVTSNWDGPKQQLNLLNCSKRHDFYVNCLVEENTGEFYKQQLIRKDNHPENLIPRKKEMPTELYGGYTGENDAYFCIVEDRSKPRKKAFSMVGVPIRIVALEKQNPNVIFEYFKGIGISEPHIIKDKIKKYQHILYLDGDNVDDFYIVGAKEVINAKQLWLSDKSTRTLDSMLHWNPERNKKLLPFDIETMYDELCDRVIKFYPCFKNIGIGCANSKEKFMILPFSEKVKHISNILIVTHANSSRVDKSNWERIDFNGDKVKFDFPGSRMKNKTLKPEKIIFIDSSITGMHSRRYTVGL